MSYLFVLGVIVAVMLVILFFFGPLLTALLNVLVDTVKLATRNTTNQDTRQ